MKTALAALLLLAVLPQEDPAKNLKSKDVGARLTALEALSKEKNAKNEKLVAGALRDDDWEVAEKAADVLGKIGGPGSVDDLVRIALEAPLARLRVAAAIALAEIDAKHACESLSKKTSGKEGYIALEAMAEITTRKEAEYELKTLERLAESAKDDRSRAAAGRALVGAHPADDVGILVKLATSAHPEVACAALDAALARPDPKRCEPLVQVLARPVLPDLVERRGEQALAAAIQSAKDGAGALAEKHLATLIGAKEPAVGARGVHVLSRLVRAKTLGAKPALILLRPALAGAKVELRAAAAAALEAIADDEAWKEAGTLAKGDKEERVRRAALQALVKLKPATEDGTRAVLVDRLATDASKEVRMLAATVLGVAKNEGARAALEKALEDKEWDVAVCAAVSLGEVGGAASVERLAKLAKEATDWKLRGAAAEGLMRTAEKTAVPPLIETLADPDPSVVKGTHVFLRATAGQDLPPKPEPWREWWAKNGDKIELEARRKKPSTAAPQEGTVAPVIKIDAFEVFRDLDVMVLETRAEGDSIQSVLGKQKVTHRLTRAGKLGEDGIHGGAVFVSNCPGEIEAVDVERVRWFVLCGGHFFGSCWALHETIERALPGVVQKAETTSEVVDRVPATDCSGGSPYVAGVIQPGVEPNYALEGAHLIEVLQPERCEVLLDSPTALAHWGCGNLVVLFQAGHGTVVDSVNHFEAQDFQTIEGLKKPADRQAWAIDHMGLSYEEWRKTKGEKWWDNSLRASEQVQDLSVFRLVTNIVRIRREGAPQ